MTALNEILPYITLMLGSGVFGYLLGCHHRDEKWLPRCMEARKEADKYRALWQLLGGKEAK